MSDGSSILLFSDLLEHSPNALFSLPGLPEEHPKSVGKVGLLEWFLQWNPKDSLSKTLYILLDITQITLMSELLSQIRGSIIVLRDQIHKELGNLVNLIRLVKLD